MARAAERHDAGAAGAAAVQCKRLSAYVGVLESIERRTYIAKHPERTLSFPSPLARQTRFLCNCQRISNTWKCQGTHNRTDAGRESVSGWHTSQAPLGGASHRPAGR